MCVLKPVPSIFLVLEDADSDYSSQERTTEMSTSSWKEIKHRAATTPVARCAVTPPERLLTRKMGSKPQGAENFINCSVFCIIREAGPALALLEKSAGFKRDGDQHVANAWVTLHWS